MEDMTKLELASYCAALISIIESKEDAGIPRGNAITAEYERAYTRLMGLIRKENGNDKTGTRVRTTSAGEADQ